MKILFTRIKSRKIINTCCLIEEKKKKDFLLIIYKDIQFSSGVGKIDFLLLLFLQTKIDLIKSWGKTMFYEELIYLKSIRNMWTVFDT